MPEDDDLLEGCDLVIDNQDYDDDEVAELRALFPSGEEDKHLAGEWSELFGNES